MTKKDEIEKILKEQYFTEPDQRLIYDAGTDDWIKNSMSSASWGGNLVLKDLHVTVYCMQYSPQRKGDNRIVIWTFREDPRP